jgi:hypothetical protein
VAFVESQYYFVFYAHGLADASDDSLSRRIAPVARTAT